MKIKYLCQNTEELRFGDEVICLKFFTKQNTWRTERIECKIFPFMLREYNNNTNIVIDN